MDLFNFMWLVIKTHYQVNSVTGHYYRTKLLALAHAKKQFSLLHVLMLVSTEICKKGYLNDFSMESTKWIFNYYSILEKYLYDVTETKYFILIFDTTPSHQSCWTNDRKWTRNLRKLYWFFSITIDKTPFDLTEEILKKVEKMSWIWRIVEDCHTTI